MFVRHVVYCIYMPKGGREMQDKNWFTVEPIDKDTFAISEWKH